jgi:hypothetical protein
MNDPALSLPEQAGELKSRCDAMCRFGVDRSVLLEIARAHHLGTD